MATPNVKCSWCKFPLYRRPSRLKKQKNHFCSHNCQCRYSSKYLSGENNKLWKGGDNHNRKTYRDLVRRRKLENKAKAIKILGSVCSICKYDKCIDALEFHHSNPKEKDKNVCRMLGSEWNEKLEIEIKKCKLLCANCHREYHWKERNA